MKIVNFDNDVSTLDYDALHMVGEDSSMRCLRYSEDQPRDPDGKFASGGGSLKINGKETTVKEVEEQIKSDALAPQAYEAARVPEPTLDQKIAIVERVRRELVNRQGVSESWAAGHVVVSFDTPPTFSLGGTARQYAGSANLNNGIITLYPKAYGSFDRETGRNEAFEKDKGAVLAHEVMHDKFEGVMSRYMHESELLHSWASGNPEDQAKFDAVTVKVTGYLDKEKSADQFPVMSKLEGYLSERAGDLYKEDGCTKYSEKWWDEWNHGNASTKMAIHETLAEMARLDYVKQTEGAGAHLGRADGLSKNWMGLYAWVNQLAEEGKFGQ